MAGYFNSVYNPYNMVGQTSFSPYVAQPYTASAMPVMQNGQYMINVDGEIAARAWQMPTNLAPNTIIPLYDLDGQHVYFKSVDAYGRINPLRKARIVFEEEQQNLPQGGQSGQSGVSETQSIELPDMTKYVTKDDFESLKQDLRSMIAAQAHSNSQYSTMNQNGSDTKNNRGGNR